MKVICPYIGQKGNAMKKLLSIILSCLMLASVFSVTASAQEGTTYYLFGYINGKNYACEEDFENMGEYRFENGTLTASFDDTSYVAVKEDGNAEWYMTDGWMGDVSSVTLMSTKLTGSNSNKLKVPGNCEVTFTLTENGDGTLALSYTTNYGEQIRARLWEYVNEELKQTVLAPGSDWTEESFAPFKTALDAANAALDNLSSTDEELESAYNTLKSAEKNLAPADEAYWRNKLSALVAECSVDFENIDALYEKYTKQSVDTYHRAYSEANELLTRDGVVYKYELTNAYTHLKNYRKGLKNKLEGFSLPDDFETALNDYVKQIGAAGMESTGDPYVRTIDGREVVEYRGLRFFSTDRFIVFGLRDMLCTVGEEIIGGYKFSNPVFEGAEQNKTGLCVYYSGSVCSIAEAFRRRMLTADKLAEIIPYTQAVSDEVDFRKAVIAYGKTIGFDLGAQEPGSYGFSAERYTRDGIKFFSINAAIPVSETIELGGYRFTNNGISDAQAFDIGLGVYKDGTAMKISDAVKAGITTYDELATVFNAEKIAPATEPSETNAEKPTMPVVVPTKPSTEPTETGVYLETTAPVTYAPVTDPETEPTPVGENYIGELSGGVKLYSCFIPSPPWMHAFYRYYGKYVVVNYISEDYEGFFVLKDGAKLMLSEAYEQKTVDMDEVAVLVRSKGEIENFNTTNFINTEENPDWKLEYKEYYFSQDDVTQTVPTEPATEKPTETQAATGAPTEPPETETQAPTTPPATETQAPTIAPTAPQTTETQAPTIAPTEPQTDPPTICPTAPKEPKPTKKTQNIKLTAKVKTVKAAKAKKARQVITGAITVKNSVGKLMYSKLSGSKYLTITQSGKIVLKKGKYKKNTVLKIKVKVTAKGSAKYKQTSKSIIAKIKIK